MNSALQRTAVLIGFAVTMLLSACEKEITAPDKNEHYMRVYMDLSGELTDVKIDENGDLYLCGVVYSTDSAFVVVRKTDSYGQEIWTHKKGRLSYASKFMLTDLNDGSYLVSAKSSDEVMRIDQTGSEKYHKRFLDGQQAMEYTSHPVIDNGGKVFISGTSLNRNNHILWELGGDGTGNERLRYTHGETFGFKTINHWFFNITHVTDGEFWFTAFTKNGLKKQDLIKFNRYTGVTTAKSITHQSHAEKMRDDPMYVYGRSVYNGEHILMVGRQTHYDAPLYGRYYLGSSGLFNVYKVDLDMNKVWSNVIGVKGLMIEPLTSEPLSDGGLMVVGYYSSASRSGSIVLTISENGELLKTRFIDEEDVNARASGVELNNEDMYLFGYNKIGNGTDLLRTHWMLIKTSIN